MAKKLLAKINIRRPCWESVKRAYEEINEIGRKEYNETKQLVDNKYLTQEQMLEIAKMAEMAQARKRYEKIGGQVFSEFNRDSNAYINTCALRVSYALNYGGMPLIKNNLANVSGTKLLGKDGYTYYTGMSGIKELLLAKWKKLLPYSASNNKDFYKVFYGSKYEYSFIRENPLKTKQIRQINRDFFAILANLNIQGIVTMNIDCWEGADGHTTLWGGKHFIDETNYLNDEIKHIFVRELCFWELK